MNEGIDKRLKDPHEIVTQMGNIKVIYGLTVAKDYPNTCAAMDKVAKAEARDDKDKREGQDDYADSLDKLFNAFDTFIRENTRGKYRTGDERNYDLRQSGDLTIFLIWQIRHVRTHLGGVIDEKCKTEYEKVIKRAQDLGTRPLIDLPNEITVGNELTIGFKDYRTVKECIFNYIKEHASEGDYKLLSTRSSITDLKTRNCFVYLDYEFGRVEIDLVEAYEKGCLVDPNTKDFIFPGKARYNFTEQKIILENGDNISAKLIRFRNFPPLPVSFYSEDDRLVFAYDSEGRNIHLAVQFNEKEESIEARIVDNKYTPPLRWEYGMAKDELMAIGKRFEKKFQKKKRITSRIEYYQFNEHFLETIGQQSQENDSFRIEPFLNALLEQEILEKKRMVDTLNDRYPVGIVKKLWGAYLVFPLDDQWMFYMNVRTWLKLMMNSPIYQGINEFMAYIEDEGVFDHYGRFSPEVIQNAKVFLFSHIRRLEIRKNSDLGD